MHDRWQQVAATDRRSNDCPEQTRNGRSVRDKPGWHDDAKLYTLHQPDVLVQRFVELNSTVGEWSEHHSAWKTGLELSVSALHKNAASTLEGVADVWAFED